MFVMKSDPILVFHISRRSAAAADRLTCFIKDGVRDPKAAESFTVFYKRAAPSQAFLLKLRLHSSPAAVPETDSQLESHPRH